MTKSTINIIYFFWISYQYPNHYNAASLHHYCRHILYWVPLANLRGIFEKKIKNLRFYIYLYSWYEVINTNMSSTEVLLPVCALTILAGLDIVDNIGKKVQIFWYCVPIWSCQYVPHCNTTALCPSPYWGNQLLPTLARNL